MEASGKQPVLAVWEDLHWADPSTLEMLGLILDQTPTVPMLNVLTSRPEFTPPWSIRSHVTPITLNRLERPQVEAFMRHLTGGKALPREVVEHIVTKTDGVPLYVEELTKMLLASELLREDTDQYVLTGPLLSITIPDSVQDSLMARLDQMNMAKGVAQLGAVIGREFPYDILQAISSQDEETLQAGLTQLVEAELLYQRGRPPRAKYIFKHALIQDAAYQSLLRRARQQVHQQIAQVLETQFPEVVEHQPELLAHHAMQGEEWDKALRYYRQAGAKSMEQSAYQEAVVCYEQALDALQHFPENRETIEHSIDLRVDLHYALIPLGAYERILDHLRAAEALGEALGDTHRLGLLACQIGSYFQVAGDFDQAIASFHRALALCTSHETFDIQVQANVLLGRIYEQVGDYRQALEVMQRTMHLLEHAPSDTSVGELALPSVSSRSILARCHAEMGDFDKGKAIGEDGVRIAESIDDPWNLIAACIGVGYLALCKGDMDQAIDVFERGLAVSQTTQISFFSPLITSELAVAYALVKRTAEALTMFEPGVEQISSTRPMAWSAMVITKLSEASLLVGRLKDTDELVARALILSRERNQRSVQAYALRLLGDIAMHRDPAEIDQAKPHYQQALTLANELGMRPLQAHCHHGLGVLYSQTGQSEQARAELSMAIEMYREMAMTCWLPLAEVTLTQVK